MLPCLEKSKLRLNSGRFGVILSVLLCTFGNLGTHAAGSNCTYKKAAQRLSPLQGPPVVLAALVAMPGTQILPSSLLMLKPKSRFRNRILEFILYSSGLSFILPLLHETPMSTVQTTFRQRL